MAREEKLTEAPFLAERCSGCGGAPWLDGDCHPCVRARVIASDEGSLWREESDRADL